MICDITLLQSDQTLFSEHDLYACLNILQLWQDSFSPLALGVTDN